MSLADWLGAFREFHEKARRGKLAPKERAVYYAGRDELARALLTAQRLTLKPGEVPRHALRVALALQVDLEMVTSRLRTVTIDLSVGGFGTLLAKAPQADEDVKYALRLPEAEPLEGVGRVVEAKAQPSHVRVCFAFKEISEADRERLELLIFDTVLARMARE